MSRNLAATPEEFTGKVVKIGKEWFSAKHPTAIAYLSRKTSPVARRSEKQPPFSTPETERRETDAPTQEIEGKYLEVAFVVPGNPVPKGRPRVGVGHTFTPERTRLYEARVRTLAVLEMAGKQPFEFGVRITVEARVERAKNGNPHRIDLDNIFKSISDAINGVVYLDDSQIVEAHLFKISVADDPGVTVTVSGRTI